MALSRRGGLWRQERLAAAARTERSSRWSTRDSGIFIKLLPPYCTIHLKLAQLMLTAKQAHNAMMLDSILT